VTTGRVCNYEKAETGYPQQYVSPIKLHAVSIFFLENPPGLDTYGSRKISLDSPNEHRLLTPLPSRLQHFCVTLLGMCEERAVPDTRCALCGTMRVRTLLRRARQQVEAVRTKADKRPHKSVSFFM
jgi:hypothetical protein